ncbi:MalY/PatB family protein [Bifidobacterium cuniculi]|uniref:cysteine-S-conjugate beta-lyase n=1 Tax=Bifidobacterium cuniculi TaxID=1688 RepID=A0A087B3T9_9BIFI|nr:MalY/PatB family protein [Bifidobacterium cuniculi]KFI65689.1 cystathionine beta-lyase [Bifidobacterium cuniculi]
MHYDFETTPQRRRTSSVKWHLIEQDMGEGSEDVLAMSVADMEFKPAPQIVDALVKAAQEDVFGYDYATDEYYDAVIGWMERRHGLVVDPSQIALSDGVMPAINTALRAFTHPGDRVIIQRPVYYPFTAAVEHNGLTLCNNALVLDGNTHHYAIDFDSLERMLAHPRCTAMLLCNPHNPVGRVWSEEELRRIGDLCIEHGVLLLVDEIHADFSYPGHPVTMFGTLGERYAQACIEFTAPTKTFNLAGLACSNAIIADRAKKQRFDIAAENIGGMSVSHFGLVACIAAYTQAEDWLDELLQVLQGNLAMLRDFVRKHPRLALVEPEGTYLAWLDCRGLGLGSAEALRDFMRTTARIYFDEGALFGPEGEGFERVNLACTPDFLRQVLDRVDAAYHTLA